MMDLKDFCAEFKPGDKAVVLTPESPNLGKTVTIVSELGMIHNRSANGGVALGYQAQPGADWQYPAGVDSGDRLVVAQANLRPAKTH